MINGTKKRKKGGEVLAKFMASKVPNKIRVFKFLRIVLWVFLLILLIRGVSTFFKHDSTAQAVSTKEPYVLSGAAEGFVDSFVLQFYTFDPNGQMDQYKQSLTHYFAKQLNGSLPIDYQSMSDPMKASNVHIMKVTKVDSTHANYVVSADLTITKQIKDSKGHSQVKNQTTTRYINVPVSVQNGVLFINDYPTFVTVNRSVVGKAAALPQNLPNVSDSLKKSVTSTVKDFYGAYSQDSESQLRFYTVQNMPLKGYGNAITFKQLNNIYVYDLTNQKGSKQKKTPTKVVAYTDSNWFDNSTGMTFRQHETIIFVYQNQRWLIQKMEDGWNENIYS